MHTHPIIPDTQTRTLHLPPHLHVLTQWFTTRWLKQCSLSVLLHLGLISFLVWPLVTVLVSGFSHSLSISYTLCWYLYVSIISPLARLLRRQQQAEWQKTGINFAEKSRQRYHYFGRNVHNYLLTTFTTNIYQSVRSQIYRSFDYRDNSLCQVNT